jgi:hypothetical protein
MYLKRDTNFTNLQICQYLPFKFCNLNVNVQMQKQEQH